MIVYYIYKNTVEPVNRPENPLARTGGRVSVGIAVDQPV